MFEKMNKFIASVLVVILISGATDAHALSESQKNLSLSSYGTIDEIWSRSKTAPHVYFIQDAHDSVDAQRNIAGLIGELTQKNSVHKVFEEGYEGVVPVEHYFGAIDPKIKKRAADYYLKQLLINGPEYARIFSQSSFDLIGIEQSDLYLKNIQAYQEAARSRDLILGEVSELKQEIKNVLLLKGDPRQKKFIQNWIRQETNPAAFVQYATSIIEFLKKEGDLTPTALRLENLFKGKAGRRTDSGQIFSDLNEIQTTAENKIFGDELRVGWKYFKNLCLLEALSRIEMNPAQAREAAQVLAEKSTQQAADWLSQEKHQSIAVSQAWEKLLAESLAFYEVVAERDKIVIQKLKQLQPGENVALVFGGFHKDHLTQLMREANISYTVLTPKIFEIQSADQAL